MAQCALKVFGGTHNARRFFKYLGYSNYEKKRFYKKCAIEE